MVRNWMVRRHLRRKSKGGRTNVMEHERGKRIEYVKGMGDVIRYDTSRKYSKEELVKLRKDFEKEAKKGKRICLSDLMIAHGM